MKFFHSVAANIPPYAVGPALLIVGSLMVANVAKIPWDRIGQAIPAFITLALMPLTYSIAYGAIILHFRLDVKAGFDLRMLGQVLTSGLSHCHDKPNGHATVSDSAGAAVPVTSWRQTRRTRQDG